MKAYDSHKNSNFDWFDKIPSNWNIASLNHLVTFIMGQAPHSDSYNTDGIGEIFVKTGDFGILRPTAKWHTTTPLVFASEKDVFMCVVGATSGKVNLGIDGTISRSIAALRPNRNISQKFLYYFLSCNYQMLNDSAQGSAQGIINKTILSNVKMPIPSIEEQTQIASFLDYKTGLIDATIEKKKRLIDLLKEKRQAVINEAVTKGLNANAPMRDSGVEWLGEIPKQWKLVPLRYLYNKIGSGVTPKGGGDAYVDEGVTFIRSQNVHFNGLRLVDVVKIDSDTHQKMNNSNVEFNDVLLNITGASIGRCCVVNVSGEMNVNQHVCIIRVNEKIQSNYLNVVLQSNVGQIQIKLLTTGGNREGLTQEAVKNMSIPLPDIETQKELLNTISEKLNNYDLINTKILLQIKKLQNYRQSLISEAVTGKIDVRDWEITKN
jgi:type I restriction enzyme S subunit